MNELPYSMNNEQAVIYAMLFNNEWIDRLSFLSKEDFYMRPHKEIYEVITSEYSTNGMVTIETIEPRITDDVGGFAYLTDIWVNTSSDRGAMASAKVLVGMTLRRKAMVEFGGLVSKLSDPNEDALASISEINGIIDVEINRLSSDDILTIDDLIEMSMDEMEQSNQNLRTGLATGIEEIDIQLGYKKLAFGEITFLGAQSKNGKTTFANTITARCELLPDEVAHIFSIEMPAAGMFNGIVSAMSGVPSDFYCRQGFYAKRVPGKFDTWFGNWGESATKLRDSNRVTIDGKKDVDMNYICSEMRKQFSVQQSKGKKLKLVVIDHLHRMEFKSSNEPRTYAMREAIRKLKNTASDLGIAVLLLGQLNEAHAEKEPNAFQILDTSGARHEIQCFIGSKIFREGGNTYFGVYSDAHRYADEDTQFHPHYMRMQGGVIKPLPDNEKHWTPKPAE
ncbi:P-loop containing nucleoside triphosphate hydrolase [Vibrio phage 1.029.O._10N.261.55.A7]|nr:P-loop containing nucleoside triphosphate hydrolase [Vibrio phage 1.029.O._10N.261.55.A7]